MGSERSGLAAVAFGRRLFIRGGYDADGNVLRSVERFDPEHNKWEALPPMISERYGAAAAAVGGRLYICGGRDFQTELNSVESFDPTRQCWEPQPLMRWARAWGAAATFCMPRSKLDSRPNEQAPVKELRLARLP